MYKCNSPAVCTPLTVVLTAGLRYVFISMNKQQLCSLLDSESPFGLLDLQDIQKTLSVCIFFVRAQGLLSYRETPGVRDIMCPPALKCDQYAQIKK